jgi:hypothetical protein
MAMMVRGLARAATRSQGSLAGAQRSLIVRQTGLRFDAPRLEAFRRVCEFEGQRGGVPLTFPEVHFTPLIAQAVVSAEFALSPLGLIHVRQEVEQLVPLRPERVFDATAQLVALRVVERGVEVDFSMLLTDRGEPAWTGIATLLSRAPGSRSGGRVVPSPATSPAPIPGTAVDVPGHMGRAFARVSGDYNPHHLFAATARPLGYRRPIAHGMWTFARALGPVLREVDSEQRVVAWADFKKPLLMPGRALLFGGPLTGATTETRLEVRDSLTGAPHLIGAARVVL